MKSQKYIWHQGCHKNKNKTSDIKILKLRIRGPLVPSRVDQVGRAAWDSYSDRVPPWGPKGVKIFVKMITKIYLQNRKWCSMILKFKEMFYPFKMNLSSKKWLNG